MPTAGYVAAATASRLMARLPGLIPGGASRWAVLRLLDRSAPSDDARCPDGLAWSWSRVSGDPAASVGFVFETDPRAVFDIQLADDAVGGAP